ncbi:ester cyclase [Chloroflexota bacterium]
MTTNTEQFVKNLWAAWNSHNWEKMSIFYSDDCIVEDLPSKTCHGKQELEAYYKYLLVGYPDLNFEAKRSFGTDNQIATEWTMSRTHTRDTARFKATGKKITMPGASILEVQGRKIIRETDYWDMHSLLQQLELMQPMGQK